MDFTGTSGVLTEGKLREMAPSVFTTDKREGLSDRYFFIPTFQVVQALESNGWLPVYAQETHCRDEFRRGFQKHMLRFRNFNERTIDQMILEGDIFVELVLVNSHDGGSGFVFSAGLFRLVCRNGMVVAEESFQSINIRHSSYSAKNIGKVCDSLVQRVPEMAAKVGDMRKITLLPEEQAAFAAGAKILRFEDPSRIDDGRLLVPRREEDKGNDLWTKFNVVQENIFQGGIEYKSNGKRGGTRRTRPIKSVDKNLKVNQALWAMAEELRKYKTGEKSILDEAC